MQPLTLARASNPRLCPSTVSMPWDRANLRFPSITKATCWGTGPCWSAPIRSSLRLVMAYSTGGEARNQFRSRDICMEPDMMYYMSNSINPLNSNVQRRGEKSLGGGDVAEPGCVAEQQKRCTVSGWADSGLYERRRGQLGEKNWEMFMNQD